MVRLRCAFAGGAPVLGAPWSFARSFIVALLLSSLASPLAFGAPSADNASAVTKMVLVPAGVPVRAPLVSTEAVSGDTVSMILTVTASISGQIAVTADVGGRTPEFSAQAPLGGTIRVSEGRSPDLPGNIVATVLVWDGTDQVAFTCTTTLSGEGVVRVPERCLVPAPRVTIEVDFPPRLQTSPSALPSTGAGGMARQPRSAPRAAAALAAQPVAAPAESLIQAIRHPLPAAVVSRFLAALRADPSGQKAVQYLDTNLEATVRSGQSVASLVGLPNLYQSFSVAGRGPEATYTSHAGVRATLVYASGSIQRDFELRVNPTNGVWRIDQITPVGDAMAGGAGIATPRALPASGGGGTATPANLPPIMLAALLLGAMLIRAARSRVEP